MARRYLSTPLLSPPVLDLSLTLPLFAFWTENAAMIRYLLFLSLVVSYPLAASADIHNCNGTWTNQPCTSEATQTIKEHSATSTQLSASEISEKRSIFHELSMLEAKARKDFHIKVDISEAAKLCLDSKGGIEECRTVSSKLDDKITERMKDAALIKAKEDSVKLQKESNELARTQNIIQQEQTNVTVINPIIEEFPTPEYRPLGEVSTGITLKGKNTEISIKEKQLYRQDRFGRTVPIRRGVH